MFSRWSRAWQVLLGRIASAFARSRSAALPEGKRLGISTFTPPYGPAGGGLTGTYPSNVHIRPTFVTSLSTLAPVGSRQRITVDGYSAPGDGGGGECDWNATDTRVPDGGTIFAVNATTIASGSNGASLPQATISVASTSGLPASGTVTIVTSAGAQIVTYAGLGSGTLTGCSGGVGTMSTGALVAAPGRWNRVYSGPINVAWYGANGAVGGDCTVAIQAAINQALLLGREVFIPSGSYAITSTIKCDNGAVGVVIRGAGNQRSIIYILTGASEDGFVWAPASQYAYGGGLFDCYLVINSYGTSRDSIVVGNMANFTMSRVFVIGAGRHGLACYGGLNIRFNSVAINNPATDCVYLGAATQGAVGLGTTTLFTNCYFHGGGRMGVESGLNQSGTRFDNCIFESCGINPTFSTTTTGSNPVPVSGSTTLNVGSTASFTPAGWILVTNGLINLPISYTGKTSTAFTGCNGGNVNAGTITAGSTVQQIDPVNGVGLYAPDGAVFTYECHFENNGGYDAWYGDKAVTPKYGADVAHRENEHGCGPATVRASVRTLFDAHCIDSSHIGGIYNLGNVGQSVVAVDYAAQVNILGFPRTFLDLNYAVQALPPPTTPDDVALLSALSGNGLYKGRKFSFLSVGYSPGAVGNASFASVTVNVPFAGGSGATANWQPVPGDLVSVGYSGTLAAGCFLTGTVTRAWTSTGSPAQVRVDFCNLSGGSVTPASGTLRIDIMKHTDVGTL